MIVTVDTGGTKTLVAEFHKNGEPGQELRFETPTDPKVYLETLLQTIRGHYRPSAIDALSIAVPGQIRDGVVLWCGNLPWRNFKLRAVLEKEFSCPVFIENDADLAGLAEANSLSTPVPLCLFVTISTGIGSGILINGRLTPELSGSEAGHMAIEFDGKLRSWESFASGKAIYETYGKHAYDIEDSAVWSQIADKLARGFAALIPPLQPQVVVLGGSIGTHYPKFSKPLKAALKDMLPEHIPVPEFHQAIHPQEAVIYGCYYHAVHRLAD